MILSDLPATPFAMSEQLARENNEEILLRIDKMMSEDDYVHPALKKQLENRQALEKEISPNHPLEDDVVLSESLTIEMIMDGDNFYVTFDVKPSQREVSLNARKYLQR